MNLAIHTIETNLGTQPVDTFLRDLHPDLKADYILANPPFNVSDWSGQLLEGDVRWRFGKPPNGNADYAWIQHFIHHLAVPNGKGGGVAGFVMANGSLSTNTSGEGDIRRKIVEADLVDCIVALPAQLFYTTGIPFPSVDVTAADWRHCDACGGVADRSALAPGKTWERRRDVGNNSKPFGGTQWALEPTRQSLANHRKP